MNKEFKYVDFYVESIEEVEKVLSTLKRLQVECYLNTDWKENKISFSVELWELNEARTLYLKIFLMKADVLGIQFA